MHVAAGNWVSFIPVITIIRRLVLNPPDDLLDKFCPTYPLLPGIMSWYTNQRVQYDDVIMGVIASQITSLTIVYSTVYSTADQRNHQSSAPLAFVRGIHRGPVNFPHKWPVTRKMFPFDDVIMNAAEDQCVEPKPWNFISNTLPVVPGMMSRVNTIHI